MTRAFMIGMLAMALVVVASNILVQFLLGDWLTWGAFTYPFAFLVTDLTNRTLGARAARRVVAGGFVIGVACSLVASQLTGPEGYPLTTFRIAAGSGLAFLLAQLVDIGVFDRLRAGSWWRAPFVSSLAGSALDTLIFFSVAFSAALSFIDPAEDVSWAAERLPLLGAGPEVPLWVSLASADFLVKMALALVALIPFRLLMGLIAARRAA
ncbi:queuosine precursor transporter [Oceanicella sp. SM1341]|uniref:queuosine precursor transporter n=1 Tax=Oceanicella sp. SM1341 TaxID=1548889 RepID=UPI000E52A7BB|nr:queuosine precursor transporter [Oceanicella sp. SM1341]